MKKKTKGWLAGAAGAAVLLGTGGTFALWSDSAQLTGNNISTGVLDIEEAEPKWYDVSPDRDERQIEPAEFHLVPGDTIEGRTGITPQLVGDNLIANLTVVGPGGEAQPLPQGISVNWRLGDQPVGSGTAVELLPGQAILAEQLIATVEFAADTPGRVSQRTEVPLGAFQIRLEQVRPSNA